jgi:hypothetical protein
MARRGDRAEVVGPHRAVGDAGVQEHKRRTGTAIVVRQHHAPHRTLGNKWAEIAPQAVHRPTGAI